MSEADELQCEACWTGYKQVGFKKSGRTGKRVPNCVPKNEEINIDGFRVLVPNASSHLLDGIEIDYVDRLMGGGFKINNPNAESSCGCGESFA